MSPAARQIRIVFITTATRADAVRLGRALIERRLAACVNCVPRVTSLFHWQGRIDTCTETLVIVKTTTRRLPALIRTVQALHAYDVPEILALPAVGGSPAYLNWVLRSCTPHATGTRRRP